MKKIMLGRTQLEVPVVAVGCMRLKGLDSKQAANFIASSLELGGNFFDHADIYGAGDCERIFADAIKTLKVPRDKLILQSKCGIKRIYNERTKENKTVYDFSTEYILSSVDGILERLKTDYLDVLLLHRPDALVQPEEVAEAFDKLQESGKVRHFGVSNQNPAQISLLQKYVRQPISANQLQLSIMNQTMISSGINVNTPGELALDRDGGVLDYCRLNDITIQPWSPFQYGTFSGVYVDNPDFPEVNKILSELAEKYNVTKTTIVIAWILRHPAKMQPVTGTMKAFRLAECFAASDITLTREEWYDIYKAAGNKLP